jgi:hypothetical protein
VLCTAIPRPRDAHHVQRNSGGLGDFRLAGIGCGSGVGLEGGFLIFVYWLYTRVLVPDKE